MKIIIEEGDAGGQMAPGVYDAGEHVSAFIDQVGQFRLLCGFDAKQKPRPVPAGGRYDFEFSAHKGENFTRHDLVVRDRIEPMKDYATSQSIDNYMIATSTVKSVMAVIVRELVQGAVQHLVGTMAQATAPGPATCDKSAWNCKQKGNVRNFGGDLRSGGPCPFKFGDIDCRRGAVTSVATATIVVGTQLKWDLGLDIYRVSKITSTSGIDSDQDKIEVSFPKDRHTPVIYTRGELMKLIQSRSVTVVGQAPGAIKKGEVVYTQPQMGVDKFAKACKPLAKGDFVLSNGDGAFVSSFDLAETGKAPAKDCDVCYGTGRFKGFGGPCSEGCPAKGGV